MDSDAPPVCVRFRGCSVSVSQIRRRRESHGGEDETGWRVWPASAVLLRWLSDDGALAAALSLPSPRAFSSLRLLDLSAGAGLVACACAAAGARVAASEVASALPLLRGNASAAGAAVAIEQLYWGEEPPPALLAAGAADLVLACDIVFCALRDGRSRELSWTLRRLLAAHACTAIAFCWEERRIAEEDAFVRALALPLAGAGPEAPALSVEEVEGDEALVLPKVDRLLGAGGYGEEGLDGLFYTPPPVRIALLRLPKSGA